MNRTGIEWCDYSWNPITGCTRRCVHCYAMRMAYRLRGRFGYPEDDPFKPTFHPERLDEPSKLNKPSRIFVCSMGDIFDPAVKSIWVKSVLEMIKKCPQHRFLILTQCPENIVFPFPKNCFVGVTVKHQSEINRVDVLIKKLAGQPEIIKFVSFEPLLEYISPKLEGIDWVIIGALTGRKQKNFSLEWVLKIMRETELLNIPIFLKNNLKNYGISSPKPIQNFPRYKK